MKYLIKLTLLMIAVLLLTVPIFAGDAEGSAELEYKLILTDQNGRTVLNPRDLQAGATLNVEIELTRKDDESPVYRTYGLEFRLLSRGLEFNRDGTCFRSGTEVTKQLFMSGDSVGFAYYDLERVGEPINNPALAGRWSYTVTDPKAVNITVPVALMFIEDDLTTYEPVGNAQLILDPNGGRIVGEDVSGVYQSGTVVTLPGAEYGENLFLGWSDGVKIYAPGSAYTVTGFVTLTAMWQDLVRNRQVLFNPNGGEIVGPDPSGMYADGEIVRIPEARFKDYALSGWTMGGATYAPGDEYTVDNSVIFIAQWEKHVPPSDDAKPSYVILWAAIAAAALLLVWWLLLLLWRRYVRYSSVDGGARLSYRDRKRESVVQVFLTNQDREFLLDESGTVASGEKLDHINGIFVVLGLKRGFYRGRLHVTYSDSTEPKDLKIRIHVLRKELNKEDSDTK